MSLQADDSSIKESEHQQHTHTHPAPDFCKNKGKGGRKSRLPQARLTHLGAENLLVLGNRENRALQLFVSFRNSLVSKGRCLLETTVLQYKEL